MHVLLNLSIVTRMAKRPIDFKNMGVELAICLFFSGCFYTNALTVVTENNLSLSTHKGFFPIFLPTTLDLH